MLGSAAIAVLIDSRLAANGLEFSPSEAGGSTGGGLPGAVLDPFSTAMAQSMLLPAGILLFGVLASLAYARPRHMSGAAAAPAEGRRPGRLSGPVSRGSATAPGRCRAP